MNLPKGYEWVKPGAVGLLPSGPLVAQFISEPYLSDVFVEPIWFADIEMGSVHLEGWIDAKKIPSEFAALNKARAVLAEYAHAVKSAKTRCETVPKDSMFFQLTEENKALLALADALENN